MPRRLLLVLGLVVASLAAGDRKKCVSGLKGDYQYEACGSFCKASQASRHCSFCKCRECSYCKEKEAIAVAKEKDGVHQL